MAELFKFLSATDNPRPLKKLMKGIGIYLGMLNASESDQNETTLTQQLVASHSPNGEHSERFGFNHTVPIFYNKVTVQQQNGKQKKKSK